MNRGMGWFVGTLLLMVGAISALAWQVGPRLDSRFIPGVWIWRMPVGGMTPEEAAPALDQAFRLQEPRIILVGPEDQRWAFAPADLGVTVDTGGTLRSAYAAGHTASGLVAISERLQVMIQGQVVAPVFSWERARAEARLAAIAAELDRPARDARVRLDGTALSLEAGEVGRQVDVTATLAALEPVLRSPGGAIELPLVVHSLAPQISDADAEQALDVARTILASPLTLVLKDPQQGDPGPWVLTPEVLAEMLVVRAEPEAVWVGLDEAGLGRFLEPLALALRREPVDARFRFDPDQKALIPVQASALGRALDVTTTITQINQMVRTGTHFVPLVMQQTEPHYRDTITAEELGIRELVSTGESYFTGSSSSRDHNIQVGTAQFEGVIVAPGETFSFNHYLGDVTPEKGYDESYVIIGNRTVPGVGGGICQVATTVFRAAFFGGYPIVERWAHAYRVTYYELGGFGPGFDATVYSPLVDFRFTNDTPYHLLIQTEVDAAHNRLRFFFYSTGMGRVVEKVGPSQGAPEAPGAPVYELDPTLQPGAVVQIETAHTGLNAVLERVVKDADGKILYQDRFVSRFVPWPARFRYGEGYVPPAEAVVVTPAP